MQLSSQTSLLIALAAVLLVLILVQPGARARLSAAFRGVMKFFFIAGLITTVILSVLLLDRSVGVPGPLPGSGAPGGSSSGAGSYPAGYTGTLSVSDDRGYLLVNGGYIGHGHAVITLPVGYHTLTAISPSTGRKCWETSIHIDGGRTTTVRYRSYCQ